MIHGTQIQLDSIDLNRLSTAALNVIARVDQENQWTEDQDMNSHRIKDLGAPVLSGDACNKQYVDTTIGANYVLKAGDSMSGYLTLSADPVNALHAATKQYVDAHIGGGVAGSGTGHYITMWDGIGSGQTVLTYSTLYQYPSSGYLSITGSGARLQFNPTADFTTPAGGQTALVYNGSIGRFMYYNTLLSQWEIIGSECGYGSYNPSLITGGGYLAYWNYWGCVDWIPGFYWRYGWLYMPRSWIYILHVQELYTSTGHRGGTDCVHIGDTVLTFEEGLFIGTGSCPFEPSLSSSSSSSSPFSSLSSSSSSGGGPCECDGLPDQVAVFAAPKGIQGGENFVFLGLGGALGTGSLGIGGTPGANLHINQTGNATLQMNGSGSQLTLSVQGSSNLITSTAPASLDITSGSNLLYIKNGAAVPGDFGFNCSPYYFVDLAGSIRVPLSNPIYLGGANGSASGIGQIYYNPGAPLGAAIQLNMYTDVSGKFRASEYHAPSGAIGIGPTRKCKAGNDVVFVFENGLLIG